MQIEEGVFKMIVTFTLSLICIVVGLCCWRFIPLYRRNKYKKRLREKSGTTFSREKHVLTPFQIFLICWFLGTAVFLVPYAWSDGNKNGLINFFECIRMAMRVFVVSDSIESLTQNLHPWFTQAVSDKFVEVYYTFAAGICVLSGFFVFGFFVSFFKEFVAYFDYRLIHRFKDIYVMNELNERSLALAENIFSEEKNARIYFCDMTKAKKDEMPELVNRVHMMGAFTMMRDVTEVRMKGRFTAKSQTVYFIGNNESENIEQAKHIVDLYKKNSSVSNGRTSLFVYANSPESELILDDMNRDLYVVDEPMKLRRVNTFNKFAVSHFWNNSTDKAGNGFFDVYNETPEKIKNLNVVLVGCGKYGSEFLKMLCSMGQMPSYRLNVHLFDDKKDIEKTFVPEMWKYSAGAQTNKKYKEKSEHWYDVPYYNLDFVKGVETDSPEFYDSLKEIHKKTPITHIYLMLGNDDLNLSLAMKIRKEFNRGNHECDDRPLINAFIRDDVKNGNVRNSERLKEFKISVIGANSGRYSKREIEQSYIENFAANIHRNYWIKGELNKFDNDLEKALSKQDGKTERAAEVRQCVKNCAIKAFRKFEHNINFLLRENVNLLSATDKNQKEKLDESVGKSIEKSKNKFEEDKKEILKRYEKGTDKLYAGICLDQAQKQLYEELAYIEENIFNDKITYKKKFGQREYYRRSCIYRVVFEKALFDLGYLAIDPGNPGRVVLDSIEKLVPEYGSETFKKRAKEIWEEKDIDPNKMFNRAWAELNNILQKRWIAFMRGEGYEYYDVDGENAEDRLRKLHRYLKPYKDIYSDNDSNIRHTIEIVYAPPKNDAE